LFIALQLDAQISYGGKPRIETEPTLSHTQVPIVQLEKIDNQKYIAEDMLVDGKDHPYRLSVIQDVALSNKTHGVTDVLPNGDRVWRLHIVTEDAEHTFPIFSRYDIPEGAELFVYTPDRELVLGGFNIENTNEDGGFYTQALPGDEFIIEYYEPTSVVGQGTLEISQVAHGYKPFAGFANKKRDKILENSSGSCQINVACSEGDGWDYQKRSVLLMYMTYGGYGYMCSGALINNTRRDKTNYFLTAYHCISDFSSITNVRFTFYFNAQTTSCRGTTGTSNQSLTGATKVAGNAKSSSNGSDFLLLKLTSSIPSSYRPFYSGWNRNASAASVGSCIHHPDGDWKKISIPNRVQAISTSGWTNFWYVAWKIGTANKGCVEGGSSGSPLFNAGKQIIGQLQGGSSDCQYKNYSDYMYDMYGRFDKSWTGGGTNTTRLSDWLAPSSSSTTSLSGLDYDGTSDIETAQPLDRTINVYPNPTKGQMNVEIPDMGEATYTVYDMMGRQVLQSRTIFSANVHQINLKSLPSGAYRLEITLNGNKYIKSILINK
ncbi:MAG: T9SS type A sorting domain-containing protein, partial [Bacteroidales bacterium]|nr:T9SS type A sorting domain-containing protein [Bacteroidales bacterium]